MLVLLEHMQADFGAALMDADAAPALLPTLAHDDERAEQRFALYREGAHAAWEKALTHAYPVVRTLLGDEFFTALARAYARTHASASGNLNGYGDRFAEFVRDFEHTRRLNYLGDVAALEWCVHRAYYAADANALARERLAAISPADLLTSRFALHPACVWVQSPFPIVGIWNAHQPESTLRLPDTLDQPEWALLARPRWSVVVASSSAAEIAALEQLRDGNDMDSAIGAALVHDTRFDFGRAVLRWLELAVLIDRR